MSAITEFILTTGRTLAQMALYSTDHPSVKGAIEESHRLLQQVLQSEKELVLSSNEGKLLVNGRVQEDVSDGSIRPFVHLLAKYDLHSLSFFPGIESQEMIPFFRLASRGESRKADQSLATVLSEQGVQHIAVNQAVYAKIREDEVIGGTQATAGEDATSLWDQMEGKSLNDVIKLLVGKAVTDPKERDRIFNHVYGLIKGEIEAVVKRATDEFTREKERLTNERDRTEGVVESMANGIVVVDETGRVLMMNPDAERLYGVSLGECLGKPLWEKAKQEQMIALAKDLTVPTDRPLVKEVQIHASPETQRVLRASTATVQDINGRVVGMVSVFSDVTKQKELTRLQGEFMANVTHELRSPLHAMKLALGGILEGSAGKLNKELEKLISLVNRNADRLARLIDDLLDFSKLEAGKMEIHPDVLNLAPLLKDAISSLESWAKRNQVRLEFETTGAIPLVFADSDRVLQIVVNLLSNALKFTPSGGRVTLRTVNVGEREKRMVRVEVEDTGPGIAKSDQDRIFQKFVQLKSSSTAGDVRGTGLGLSICKALVDLHKGNLTVQSPVPHGQNGSLFSFTLPAPEGVDAPRSRDVKTQSPVNNEKPSKPRKRPFWARLFRKFCVIGLLFLLGGCMSHARPRWGMVHRVLDGSTIELEDGSRVRYLGVESPTTGTEHYADALSENRRMVEHKQIQMRYGLQDRDLNGTWLAYVFVDGVLVNEALVRDGLAIVSGLTNDESYLPTLLNAEEKAKKSRAGVWRDTDIEPYPVRLQKQTGFPWASLDEIKRGKKKGKETDLAK